MESDLFPRGKKDNYKYMELNLLGWAGATQRSGGRPMPAAKPGASSSTPRWLVSGLEGSSGGQASFPPQQGTAQTLCHIPQDSKELLGQLYKSNGAQRYNGMAQNGLESNEGDRKALNEIDTRFMELVNFKTPQKRKLLQVTQNLKEDVSVRA